MRFSNKCLWFYQRKTKQKYRKFRFCKLVELRLMKPNRLKHFKSLRLWFLLHSSEYLKEWKNKDWKKNHRPFKVQPRLGIFLPPFLKLMEFLHVLGQHRVRNKIINWGLMLREINRSGRKERIEPKEKEEHSIFHVTLLIDSSVFFCSPLSTLISLIAAVLPLIVVFLFPALKHIFRTDFIASFSLSLLSIDFGYFDMFFLRLSFRDLNPLQTSEALLRVCLLGKFSRPP